MPSIRKRQGTASELQVLGQLTDAGIDCYQTLVDDQGIDAVLRVVKGNGKVVYFDVQIKSSRNWSGIRGRISELGKKENAILPLFNSGSHECLWVEAEAIMKYFPSKSKIYGAGDNWGDVFLDKSLVQKLKDEGRDDLHNLRDLLETP